MSTLNVTTDDPSTMTDVGIVYKKSTGLYTIQTAERTLTCVLSARMRGSLADTAGGHNHHAAEHLDPLVVGDQVRFMEGQGGTGMIVEVLPRRNQFSRRSAVPMPTAHPYEQVIAANVDQVVPVFAVAEPAPKWNLLDRYLVSAEAAELPALICITKTDLVLDANGELPAELADVIAEYRRIGYRVILVSAYSGKGVDEIRLALQGQVSVMLGKSGVGKTSLLNALQPGLGLRVNAVSQMTGKGKHTTTTMEMFPLESGDGAICGAIVDTPGVREFGMWLEDGYDLDWFFPEMRPFISGCRFGLDCQHDEEPGCAVRQAVNAGWIDPRRWKSYLVLRGET